MNSRNSYNISPEGVCISFAAGACICTGINFIILYDSVVGKNKGFKDYTKDYIKDISTISFLGGGMTTLGIYLLAPNYVRRMWF